jgi:hypothetical protein
MQLGRSVTRNNSTRRVVPCLLTRLDSLDSTATLDVTDQVAEDVRLNYR